MTVVSSSNTITFAGDGVQTLFDFNFKIFKEEDLAAVVRDSCGIERDLVAGSDFKLVSETGNDSGGRAMYPVSGSPLQTGDSITFYREIAYSQELELVDNDPFSAGLLNEAFDRGVMRDQQLQEQVARALKYDISTPAEDQLMPQEFMRKIIESRDASATARVGAESALNKSEAARLAAEYAKLGAETAQAAAEYAKSEAEAIAWDGIEHLRSRTPVLSGPESANEGTTVEISIVDYVEDSLANYEIDVSGFGSAKLVGSVIQWALGSVDVDTVHSLKLVKRRRGEIYSETANYPILVKNVLINDGPTTAFTNDLNGWPGAVIDAEVIQPPAFSVGAVNEKQTVSGKMEVEVTSGKKTVLDGTTATSLKTLEAIETGDLLITDQGECVVGDVTSNPLEPVTIDNWGTQGAASHPQTSIDSEIRLPNGGKVTSIRANFASTITFHCCIFEKIGSKFTCVAKQTLSTLSTDQALDLDVPLVGDFYFGTSLVAYNMWAGNSRTGAGIETEITSVGQEITPTSTDINSSTVFAYTGFCLNSCVIDLPLAPTKVFKNPLQGETLNVGAGTTATSLETNQPVNEGDSLFLDGVEGVAGTVVSTIFTGTWPVNSIVKTVTPGFSSGQDSVIKGEDGTLFAITRANLLMSVDNGVTWTIQNSSVSDSYLYSFAVCSKGYLYLAGYVRGLLRSKDKGKTWSDCRTAVCTGNPMAVGAKGNTIVMGEHTTNKVYTSYDNGDTWVMSKNTGGVHASSVYFASNGDIYEGGSGNFYVSKDNGVTFNTVSHGLGVIGYVNWFNEYDGNLYVGGTGGCGKSSDGGVTWNREPLTGTYGHGSVIAGDILYAAGLVDKNYCILKYNLSTQKQYDSMLVADPATAAYVGSFALVDNKIIYAENGGTVRSVTVDMDSYSTDITSFGLTTPPQYASRKNENTFALGAGGGGEYVGPKIELGLLPNIVESQYTPNGAFGYSAYKVMLDTVNSISGSGIPITEIGANNKGQAGETGLAIYEITSTTATLVLDAGTIEHDGSDSFIYTPCSFTPDPSKTYMIGIYQAVAGDYCSTTSEAGTTKSAVKLAPPTATVQTLVSETRTAVTAYKTASKSTTSKLILTSTGSIKDKIFVEDGLHNNILCDDAIDTRVVSVSEEVIDGDLVSVIPTFTSAAPVDGVSVSASSEHPVYPAWRAVNKVGGTDSADDWWICSEVQETAILTLTFAEPVHVKSYLLSCPTKSYLSYMPRTWSLKGQYQGGAIVELDGRVSQADWGAGEERNFDMSATMLVDKLIMGISNSSGGGLGIGELDVFGVQSKITTTANLETPLAKVPTKVAIPDRYTFTPSGYSSELSDGKFKITADKIELPDNANLKQLAMAVRSPEDMRFTDGKIYIQEKP